MKKLEFRPDFPGIEGWYIIKGWGTFSLVRAAKSTGEDVDDWDFFDGDDWSWSLSELEDDQKSNLTKKCEGFCLLNL